MSAIQTGCVVPNRPNASGRRIAKLLAYDESRRRPPISLPGRPIPKAVPPKPKPTVLGAWPYGPVHLDRRNGQQNRQEAEPEDVFGPYSREKLLQMNTRFTRSVERPFRSGGENRRAAAATYGAISTRPRRHWGVC